MTPPFLNGQPPTPTPAPAATAAGRYCWREEDQLPSDLALGKLLHGPAMAAPPAGDLLHPLREDLLVFDRELPTHCEVVKCSRSADDRDVEAGQIPAASATVSSGRHVATLASTRVLPMVHAFVLIDAEMWDLGRRRIAVWKRC